MEITLEEAKALYDLVECPYCKSVFHSSKLIKATVSEDLEVNRCPSCGEYL